MEESKEVLDRRRGVQPKTNHEPIDFLDVDAQYQESSDDGEDKPVVKVDLRPMPPVAPDAGLCSAHTALRWLRALARFEAPEPEVHWAF